MKVPNADKAIIAEDKLSNYLLNITHRRGGSKARLLLAMGYRADDWQRLEAASINRCCPVEKLSHPTTSRPKANR